MKLLKNTLTVLLFFTIFIGYSQSQNNLLGKWKTTYDYEGQKLDVVYEIKNNSNKVKAFSIKMTILGESQKDDTMVMSNITMNDGKGKTKYYIEYEGKKYNVDAKLKLKDNNTLIVSYSYYGYSDNETWKRVN